MDPQKTRYYTYIKPYLRNKTVRTYSSLIFTLLMVSVFAVYAIRPTVITITSLHKSIEEQQEISRKLKQKVSDLADGRTNYERIEQDTKTKLNNLVPGNPDLHNLIDSINALAYQSQATMSGIQFSPVEFDPINPNLSKVATAREIQLNINFQGTYPSLMGVLNGFRTLNRLVSIQSVNMNRQEGDNIIMTVSAKTMYIK